MVWRTWAIAAFGALAVSAVGCGGSDPLAGASGPTTSSAQQARCVTGPGVTTLYTIPNTIFAFQPAIAGDRIVLSTSGSVVTIPLAGGGPSTLALADAPSAPVVLNGTTYFQALQGGTFAVAVAGGDATPMPTLSGLAPVAVDESSLYLTSNSNALKRWIPASDTLVDLPIGPGLLIDGVAVQGDYVYVAADDLNLDLEGSLSSGVIARIPKAGGSVQRIVTNIGQPWNLAADESGLYWSQDPPFPIGAGPGSLARSNLDGSAPSTLLSQAPMSLVAANSRLYFSTGSEIKSVSVKGGATTTLASNLTTAGLLSIAGGNVVWVDSYEQAMSGNAPVIVMTACATP